MNQRIMIPDTDLSLCPVGLGTAAAGAKWSGKEADAIFDTYIDMGGNLIRYRPGIPGVDAGRRGEEARALWESGAPVRRRGILLSS